MVCNHHYKDIISKTTIGIYYTLLKQNKQIKPKQVIPINGDHWQSSQDQFIADQTYLNTHTSKRSQSTHISTKNSNRKRPYVGTQMHVKLYQSIKLL